jgi:hypothetical protein
MRVEFVSDAMSYLILRGRWCYSYVYSSTQHKFGDKQDILYEELGCVRDQFLKSPMKILLGDFSAKVGM